MRPAVKITLAASLAAALLLTGSHDSATAADASKLQSVTYDVGTRTARADDLPTGLTKAGRKLGLDQSRRGHRPADLAEEFERVHETLLSFGSGDGDPGRSMSDTGGPVRPTTRSSTASASAESRWGLIP